MSTGAGQPLWWQSFRRRPLVTVLLLLLSAAAVLASASGPLLVRAVRESSLQTAIAAVGPGASSIAVIGQLRDASDIDALKAAVTATINNAEPESDGDLWSPLQLVLSSGSNLSWHQVGSGHLTRTTRVVGLDPTTGTEGGPQSDAKRCAPFVLLSGRCPADSSEAMISAPDAKELGLSVAAGGSGGATAADLSYSAGLNQHGQLRIVGIYDPSASSPWQLTRPGTTDGQIAMVSGDPLVTTVAGLVSFQIGGSVTGWLQLRDGLSVDAEPVVRAALADIQTGSVALEGRQLGVVSQLPAVLDNADRQNQSAAVTMLAVVTQAVLLSVFALVLVLQRFVRLRAPEWAVGRLRGLPTWRWLASIWIEPALALLIGAPLGYAAAVGLGLLVSWLALRPGTALAWWAWPVWSVAAATLVIALAALVIISVASLRRPLVEVIQQDAEPRRLGRVAVVIQAAVVLLAAVSVYQLIAGGPLGADTVNGSQLALLAPALVALAIALLAVRVAVLAVRLVSARPPRSAVGLVVGRQAARTPSALDPAMVVAAGLAIAVFATQLWQLSVRNQSLRAEAAAGAATVLAVKVAPGADLVAGVRRADPSGRYAMAARERNSSGDGGTSRVVAVDSSRLAAVSPWLRASLGADPAAALHPTRMAPVQLNGRQLRVGLSTTKLSSSSNGPIDPEMLPTLTAVLATPKGWQEVDLGMFRTGRSQVVKPVSCASGCQLIGFDVSAPAGADYLVNFTVESLATDTEPVSTFAALLHDPAKWRPRVGQQTDPETPVTVGFATSSAGLEITAFDPFGNTHNRIGPASVDDPLPAFTVPGLAAERFPGPGYVVIGIGLDGQSQQLNIVGRVPVLPRALGDGVLVDVSEASALSDPAADESVPEVWLSADAPAGIVAALADQGIVEQGRQEQTAVRHQLLQQAVSRGSLMLSVVGIAALGVALLTFAGARTIEAARRRLDWAAFADAGLGPTRLRLLCFVEIAAPGLLAVLLGLSSGLVAVGAAASRLPLVDTATAGPPLVLTPAWAGLGLIGFVVAAVIVVIAAIGSLVETGGRR